MTLNAHLEKYLKPLERFLKKSGVVEICINRPQEVWVETEEGWLRPKKGGPIGPFIQPELTLSHLQGMVRHIALEQGQDFSKSCPSLSTSIPEYGFRIQAFGYASSPYGISISIRCGAARTFPIE